MLIQRFMFERFSIAAPRRPLCKARILSAALLALAPLSASTSAHTQADAQKDCARPLPGSVVADPPEVRSHNGVLQADLTYSNFKAANGQEHYCYWDTSGADSPTLRISPGDLLILHLKNELVAASSNTSKDHETSMAVSDPCASARMTALSTNLHFHGLTVPPVCHEDDVLRTMVQPQDAPFEYRFRIPDDESPGLYWYHPHTHGFSNPQVLGGASGALIVEGIERANKELAGLPQRVFVIRDQELLHPDAEPAATGSMPPPPVLRDAEGEILNNGSGGGKPAKDLSINFIPVPWPDYPPAIIRVRPAERQVWRVLNASAITYLDLQILVENKPQSMAVVALDGEPLDENGMTPDRILWADHVFLPPAGRVEFLFKGLPQGAQARLITRSVDTGPAGENDPVRPLATVIASEGSPEPASRLGASPAPLPHSAAVWLGNVPPVRTRKLYFSERPSDPGAPNSPTVFMITVDGQTPAPFDSHAAQPDIVAHQGDVEDWVIENRTQEMHAFHIHQVHFMLTRWMGVQVDEPFLRDTINVPYWDGKSARYPSVTLRMDFRDPNAVGTFVYHCHLLEHEDGGMMGTIRVLPKNRDSY
ncbi:FtsP/CotA-like multicopper oxidase with cupredoxin domain [Silvibacterium bohemicum]|uniref:FtsP/CotA-like multicopper oxidase with cupredoxin domain n=1 Tax=Silvibacterium bohemicum TaxID=1577686 RepID=A0A841JQX1_9BACT|nr:multicopper oxidase domain-containing protein [Silvibacterium bohemicum]MBB6143550.1 FtsP/CotA-like multicopper oxidase with cupredoxin domain [Silvibacterium bohemicum]